jgi:hypothetical protein
VSALTVRLIAAAPFRGGLPRYDVVVTPRSSNSMFSISMNEDASMWMIRGMTSQVSVPCVVQVSLA